MPLRTHVLHREQLLDGTPEEVFGFFADAKNLEAITPPLLRFSVITPGPIEMHVGTLIEYRLRVHHAPVSWLTSIQAWEPPTVSSTCSCAAPTPSGTTRTPSPRPTGAGR